jgi:glutathione synthase/RimK-type ligase-like ATP-grasp enzyme
MNGKECWGIFRERAHSPGREFDDAEILRLTGKHLDALGFYVSLKTPDELPPRVSEPLPAMFMMCEQTGILAQLQQWERCGTCIVNSPESVLNTYRERMILLLEQAHVASPESRIVSTNAPGVTCASPVWVKRGDVHSTQEGDVSFAAGGDEVERALQRLALRGVESAVVQDHIPGDLIKFYGIGRPDLVQHDGPWFRWFYHKDQRVVGHSFDPEKLADLAHSAARALGLEIYGGDAIVSEGGAMTVIDLNAWPSFALYREEAAKRIAAYLAERFLGGRPS